MTEALTSEPDMKTSKPNVLLILNDDMGYSDIGCYGGEVETPEPRPHGRQRSAFQPVLQHRALQPFACLDADGPASAPDRRRHPHLRLGSRGLCRQPEPALRDDSAGAQGQWLQDLHERQVACGLQSHQADRHLAAAARLRRILRHHHRRRQLLRSQHADARQCRMPSTRHAPGFFYTDAISDQAVAYIEQHAKAHRRPALLRVRRLHRAALAAARA
jgi:hypothetical protein